MPACLLQEGEERDVQDQLVELLQYDNFPLIKQLLRNRTTVVWCQRLARAQNDSERSRIEVSMSCACSTAATDACHWAAAKRKGVCCCLCPVAHTIKQLALPQLAFLQLSQRRCAYSITSEGP